MGKNLPTTTASTSVRVVYYPEPARNASVVYTARQLADQRMKRELLLQQWMIRRAHIEERDRRIRRTLIRVGLVVVTVLVTAVLYGCWLVYQLFTGLPVGDIGIGLLVLLFLLGVGGGCGCVTVVQHFH